MKFQLGGEFLTESLLSYIENDLGTPIVPRHYLNIQVDGEQKVVEKVECPNLTRSFDMFCKTEIVRDLKETTCRLLDPKGDK